MLPIGGLIAGPDQGHRKPGMAVKQAPRPATGRAACAAELCLVSPTHRRADRAGPRRVCAAGGDARGAARPGVPGGALRLGVRPARAPRGRHLGLVAPGPARGVQWGGMVSLTMSPPRHVPSAWMMPVHVDFSAALLCWVMCVAFWRASASALLAARESRLWQPLWHARCKCHPAHQLQLSHSDKAEGARPWARTSGKHTPEALYPTSDPSSQPGHPEQPPTPQPASPHAPAALRLAPVAKAGVVRGRRLQLLRVVQLPRGLHEVLRHVPNLPVV